MSLVALKWIWLSISHLAFSQAIVRELKFLLFEENHIKLRKYTIVSTFRKKQKEHNDYVQTLCYCGLAAAVRIFVINHSSKSFATTFQQ